MELESGEKAEIRMRISRMKVLVAMAIKLYINYKLGTGFYNSLSEKDWWLLSITVTCFEMWKAERSLFLCSEECVLIYSC